MALTVTSNLITISDCELDDWDGNVGTRDEDFEKEGTYCLGLDTDVETNYAYKTVVPDWLETTYALDDWVKPTVLNSYVYECTTAGTSGASEPSWNTTPGGTTNDGTVVWTTRENTWTGRHFYAWLLCMTAPTLDIKANGGMRLVLVDASGNEGYWYVAGSDSYPGGWRRFICSVDSIPDANNGSDPTPTIIKIGVGFKCVAKSKLAQNTFWDYVQYDTSTSRGVEITDGAATPRNWDEVLAQDEAQYIGLIRKESGVFYVQGTMQFGDTAAGDITFEDTNQIIVYEDIAGSSDFHKISVVGNGGGTTSFKLGSKSGTSGIEGCVFKSAGSPNFQITATDADIDAFGLYGCTFLDSGTISLPPNAANREVLNCSFSACAEILADTCVVQNCTIVSPDDRGIRINSTSHNITDCSFINCPKAVHTDVAATYLFNALMFVGNTDDIENSTAGGDVYIDRTNGSNPDPAKLLNSGTPPGTITINPLSVDLTVKVVDVDTNPIELVQTAIYKLSDNTQLMNEDTNASGLAVEPFQYVAPTDIYVRVRKSSPGDTRYTPASTAGQITDTGFSVVVTLTEDPNA